tara:strand:- start:59 stop:976 length:918 start_codon:yes stop_codon:yes gene_type:complete
MTNYIDLLYSRGLKYKAKIVLPEEDERISEAKKELKALGFSIISLDGYRSKVKSLTQFLKTKKFSKHWPDSKIESYINDNPIVLGMILVAKGEADVLVAGASTSTSEIIRHSIRIIGLRSDVKWLSSIFFMISNEGNKVYTYADCGVIPDPNSEQLCEIAKLSSEFHYLITGEDPRVAFLSFSTKGSADHYRVNVVREAVSKFSNKFNIIHDGEIQLDAAISQEVALRKMEGSRLKGKANVLIFPNLDAANIAYKITERLAGFHAVGPLFQGLKKPVHDLSRGCSVEDIVKVSLIASIQSNPHKV